MSKIVLHNVEVFSNTQTRKFHYIRLDLIWRDLARYRDDNQTRVQWVHPENIYVGRVNIHIFGYGFLNAHKVRRQAPNLLLTRLCLGYGESMGMKIIVSCLKGTHCQTCRLQQVKINKYFKKMTIRKSFCIVAIFNTKNISSI